MTTDSVGRCKVSTVLDGLVRIGSEMFFFEPARRLDPDAASGDTAAYRLADVADSVPGASELRRHLERRGPRQLDGPFPFILDVAAVADHEYFLEHGGGTEARILNILNQIDVIYVDQLNITLNVPIVQIFETAADPFSEFNSGNLFANFNDATTEFGTWRNGETGPAHDSGVGHLFSDKTLGLGGGGAWPRRGGRPGGARRLRLARPPSIGAHASRPEAHQRSSPAQWL